MRQSTPMLNNPDLDDSGLGTSVPTSLEGLTTISSSSGSHSNRQELQPSPEHSEMTPALSRNVEDECTINEALASADSPKLHENALGGGEFAKIADSEVASSVAVPKTKRSKKKMLSSLCKHIAKRLH
jgi:hypothetical protein